MTIYLSRSAWGAQPPNRQSPNRAETTHLHVHHSATLNPTSTPRPDDIEEAKEQWRAFQADHLNRPIFDHLGNPMRDANGNIIYWADGAYNVGVGPGVILEGRGWDVKGGGTGPGQRVKHPSGSWDNVSVSICVIGNYKDEQLDDATRASLVEAMAEARARYGDLTVMVDRDVNFTNCCGDNLIPLVPQLWAEATGDDMPLTDAEIEKIAKAAAEAVVSRPLDIEGHTASLANWVGFLYAQVTRPDLLEKRIADAVAKHAILVDDPET